MAKGEPIEAYLNETLRDSIGLTRALLRELGVEVEKAIADLAREETTERWHFMHVLLTRCQVVESGVRALKGVELALLKATTRGETDGH